MRKAVLVKGKSSGKGTSTERGVGVSRARYVVCVRNEGYEASLECNKIYLALYSSAAAAAGELRVVDESGEDYLYEANRFVPIAVPRSVAISVRRGAGIG
jgi:hypothetical protein